MPKSLRKQSIKKVEEGALADKFKIEEYSESYNVAIESSCEKCVIHINKIKCLRKKIYRLKNKIMERNILRGRVTGEWVE